MANAVFVNLKDGRFADGSARARARRSRARPSTGAPPSATSTTTAASTWWSPRSTAPLELWRNVSPAPHHWLLVKTVGTQSNRDGMGAKIKIVTASGAQYSHVNTAVGYGCASDQRVHFGLGADAVVERADDHLAVGEDADPEGRDGRPDPDRARARSRSAYRRLSLIWRKTSNSCSASSVRPSFW